MKISSSDRPALILIDFQKGFENIEYWGGQRNNLEAEIRASELLNLWREKWLPLYHIQHCSTIETSPLRDTHPGNEFMDLLRPLPGEPIVKKNVNSAFLGTDLKSQLNAAKIRKLIIVGLTTDHCVSTTTRMAGNLGYEAFLVSDATATFNRKGIDGKNYPAELMHDTALASLNEEFATVVTAATIKRLITG